MIKQIMDFLYLFLVLIVLLGDCLINKWFSEGPGLKLFTYWHVFSIDSTQPI